MCDIANLPDLGAVAVGTTRPVKTGAFREAVLFRAFRDRNAPLFVRVPEAVTLRPPHDGRAAFAISTEAAQQLDALADKLAAFFAAHSADIFIGRTFAEDRIRAALRMPVGPLDGAEVPEKLPAHMDRALDVRTTAATFVGDCWDNPVPALRAGSAVSLLLHVDKVIFGKRDIAPSVVLACATVPPPELLPRLRVDPLCIALPDPTDSEDEYLAGLRSQTGSPVPLSSSDASSTPASSSS